MNRAFIITMYKEYGTVDKTIINIRKSFGNEAHIVLIQSTNNGELKYSRADKIICLPDLSLTVEKYKIASHAITRNYSAGFTYIYSTGIQFDYIVALCGDTLVTDATNFDRRFEEMKRLNKSACISQAIGQIFYGSQARPTEGIVHERRQDENTRDFMPQLFIVDGKKAIETKVFSDIKITNPFTSEQCLGDELYYKFKEFNVLRLARNAYDYRDGIIFQYVENI